MAIWFAGGGVKAGQVVGATDELGEKAVQVVYPLEDLHMTILHLLGLNDSKLTYFHEGRFKQLSQTGGEVIKELLASVPARHLWHMGSVIRGFSRRRPATGPDRAGTAGHWRSRDGARHSDWNDRVA